MVVVQIYNTQSDYTQLIIRVVHCVFYTRGSQSRAGHNVLTNLVKFTVLLGPVNCDASWVIDTSFEFHESLTFSDSRNKVLID